MYVEPFLLKHHCNYCYRPFEIKLNERHVCDRCYDYIYRLYTVGGKPIASAVDPDGVLRTFISAADCVQQTTWTHTFPQGIDFNGHDKIEASGAVDAKNPCKDCGGMKGMVWDKTTHTCLRCFHRDELFYSCLESLKNPDKLIRPAYYWIGIDKPEWVIQEPVKSEVNELAQSTAEVIE